MEDKNLRKSFVQNGQTFTVIEKTGPRTYLCTSENEELILSSRAINALITGRDTDRAPPPVVPSEPLTVERCIDQVEYLLGLLEHDVARVQVVQVLAVNHLNEKAA